MLKTYNKMTELIIGNKYVPHQKTATAEESLEHSYCYREAKKKKQGFLYYIGLDDDFHVFSDNASGYGDYFAPEDVTPYIEPKEEVSDYSPVELAVREQYDNVGYDVETDGTRSLYISGAKFGAEWQKEQTQALQESHDKLLQLLFDSRPLIQPAAYCKGDEFIILKDKIDLAIENAKNYAKK